MTDLYLRADDEAALADALPWCRGTDLDGAPTWLAGGDGWVLDIIGSVVITPGEIDDGVLVTPAVVDERCHANLRLSDEALATRVPPEIIIDPPRKPARVWA